MIWLQFHHAARTPFFWVEPLFVATHAGNGTIDALSAQHPYLPRLIGDVTTVRTKVGPRSENRRAVRSTHGASHLDVTIGKGELGERC